VFLAAELYLVAKIWFRSSLFLHILYM